MVQPQLTKSFFFRVATGYPICEGPAVLWSWTPEDCVCWWLCGVLLFFPNNISSNPILPALMVKDKASDRVKGLAIG